jgi:hypothetical protein
MDHGGGKWQAALVSGSSVIKIRLKFRHRGQMQREWIFESAQCPIE